jgi:hypothetical protein
MIQIIVRLSHQVGTTVNKGELVIIKIYMSTNNDIITTMEPTLMANHFSIDTFNNSISFRTITNRKQLLGAH